MESPFCAQCEESLQASLDFRANYQMGDDDASSSDPVIPPVVLTRTWYTHSIDLIIF
jgi:hypothetical protein